MVHGIGSVVVRGATVAVRLCGKPCRHTDGVWILGFLSRNQPSLHYAPQQRGVRLVREEELAEAIDLGHHRLCNPPFHSGLRLSQRSLGIPNEVRE